MARRKAETEFALRFPLRAKSKMWVKDFDYHLPKSAIAQHPPRERDQSRLLLIDRKTQKFFDHKFWELPELLSPKDVLVVNNSQVIPARIFAQRKTGAQLEITLIKKVSENEWEGLIRGKKPRPGEELVLKENVRLTFLEEKDLDFEAGFKGGLWRIRLESPDQEILEQIGVVPLPPYIHRSSVQEYQEDKERYQTIFARKKGAVASPTAGLHFTERVFKALKERGIEIVEITLYVGYGTFAPVRVERVENHKLHKEFYEVSETASQKINQAKEKGGRIIAVGTTVCRTLETVSDEQGRVRAQAGETDLFIYPGYKFKIIDALLTNFHMPRSSLLMLVSAFAGLELTKRAYQYALSQGYRFLSYGDCSLII